MTCPATLATTSTQAIINSVLKIDLIDKTNELFFGIMMIIYLTIQHTIVKMKPSYQNKTTAQRDCVPHLLLQLGQLEAQSAHQINRRIVAS